MTQTLKQRTYGGKNFVLETERRQKLTGEAAVCSMNRWHQEIETIKQGEKKKRKGS